MPFNYSGQKTPRLRTAPGRLNPIAIRSRILGLLLLLALLHQPASVRGNMATDTYSADMSWDPNSEPSVSGYRIYYGTASGNYTHITSLGKVTSGTVEGLMGGVTYYFAVTAYNAAGFESAFSAEASFMPGGLATVALRPAPNGQFILSVSGLNSHSYDIQASTNLQTWSVIGSVTISSTGSTEFTDTNAGLFPTRFYRTQSAP